MYRVWRHVTEMTFTLIQPLTATQGKHLLHTPSLTVWRKNFNC